jgi:hypothetical protein
VIDDDDVSQEGPRDEEPYGLIERQVAFKLLAAHAMVDAEFYQRLRDDPAGAARELFIHLPEDDVLYVQEVVDWSVIDKYADEIREALHTDAVVRSIW